MGTDLSTTIQRLITTVVLAVAGVVAKYLASSRLKWMDKEREEEFEILREENVKLREELAVLRHRLGDQS